MNKKKFTQFLLCFFVGMFLMVIGCSTNDDAAIYTISGTVTVYGTGTALEGVTVKLTGAATASTTTDSSGNFSFTSRANGTYTVTPSLTNYTFDPVSTVVVVDGADIANTNFVATSTGGADAYTISGKISGDIKVGVKITLSGNTSGTVITTDDGTYSFTGVLDGSYSVTPSLTGYAFTPANRSVTVSSADVTDNNFIATVTYAQSDFAGTWNAQFLKVGSSNSGWQHATATIDSSGNLTAFSNCNDSSGDTTCPTANTIKWTINTNGVISESGTGAGTDVHLTMASNKNFIAGTSTTSSGKYQLMVVQKAGSSYSSSDLYGTSFVFHQLKTGSANEWEYGSGTIDSSGTLTVTSSTTPSGTTATSDSAGTVSVDSSSGVVTFSDDANFYGFLSSDKKTIVGTETNGSDYQLLIIQITGQTYTAGSLPDAILNAHMLAGGATPAPLWAHWTATSIDGIMTSGDWVSSFGGSAPAASAPVMDVNGVVTIAGDTYHGQVSYDKKFMVGTRTLKDDSDNTFGYALIVHTMK